MADSLKSETKFKIVCPEMDRQDNPCAEPASPVCDTPSLEPPSPETSSPETSSSETSREPMQEVSKEQPRIWTSAHEFTGPGRYEEHHHWPNDARKQLFNLIYFSLGGLACLVIGNTSEFFTIHSRFGLCLFGALATLATIYAITRQRQFDTSEVLSMRTQKTIRAAALLAPMLAIFMASWNCLTYVVDFAWSTHRYPGLTHGMKADDYNRLHKQEVELASTISPFNTEASRRLFENALSVKSYPIALKLSEKVIRFNRKDRDWKIRRLGVLGHIPEREEQFQALAEKYKERYQSDGYLWNTLADVAESRKDWLLALDMANEHIKRHPDESIAFQQRANILHELGMSREADEDTMTARTLSQ